MSEWQSMDNPPKLGEHCLGFDSINSRFYEFWRMVSRNGGSYNMIYNGTTEYDITHWMPLPKSPKQNHYCC